MGKWWHFVSNWKWICQIPNRRNHKNWFKKKIKTTSLVQKCSWIPNAARLARTDTLWRGFPTPILFPVAIPKNPDLFFQHTRAAEFSQPFWLQTAMLLEPEQVKFYHFIITRLFCIARLLQISTLTNMHSDFYIFNLQDNMQNQGYLSTVSHERVSKPTNEHMSDRLVTLCCEKTYWR